MGQRETGCEEQRGDDRQAQKAALPPPAPS
jgi:hypothetical protein